MPNQILRAGRAFWVFGITAILGVLVFLFVLGGPEAVDRPKITAAKPAPVVIDKISLSVADPTKSSVTTDTLGEEPFAGGANVTHDLGKKLAAEIIKRNPTGPGPAGAQKLTLMKPAEAVDAFIADALKTFDPAAFHPDIPLAKLAIVPDSKEAFSSYFRNLQNILATEFARADFSAMNDPSKMNFPVLLSAYSRAVEALLKLPAPESLTAMHQKEISLVKGQANMMRLLSRYEEDPLQAYLALNAGDGLRQEFIALDRVVSDFIAKNNIAI